MPFEKDAKMKCQQNEWVTFECDHGDPLYKPREQNNGAPGIIFLCLQGLALQGSTNSILHFWHFYPWVM